MSVDAESRELLELLEDMAMIKVYADKMDRIAEIFTTHAPLRRALMAQAGAVGTVEVATRWRDGANALRTWGMLFDIATESLQRKVKGFE